MSYFLSNIFAVFSFVYQIEIIKMYGKVLLLIENNEETPFFLVLQFKHRICRNEYKIDRSA